MSLAELSDIPQVVEFANGMRPEVGKPWDRSVLKVNVKEWIIRANIRNNIRRQLPQFRPYELNHERIAIVGGGWSLNKTVEELRDLVFEGVKIVALNGAANWCMEHNFRPSMHIILDALKANLEFVKHDIPHCKYFIASQAHPALFDAVEGRDVTMFHVCSTEAEHERVRLDRHYMKRWHAIAPAGTVGMVSLILMRNLGYRFQHLFGMDSCYDPESGAHHAYAQPWNDPEGCPTFIVDGKPFLCSTWQAAQVQEFIDIINAMGNNIMLDVHGEGALAHIIKMGAERASIVQQEPQQE